MPAPIRPVQPGDLISAARFNEVVDALNALGRISGAFPICISHDAAGVRIELAQQFKAWLFQIEETAGVISRTTDGVAYYSASRLRLNSDEEYVAQEPQQVQLYDPLTRVAPERVLRTGDWVLATYNADTGRWEIVRDVHGDATIVRFRTTATLSIGGSAAAVIVQRSASDDVDGDAITVVDWSAPGTWYGPTGSQGIACKIADRDEYDILWIEHPSLFAVGYATGPMSAGVLPVIVTSSFDGAGPLSIADFYDVAGNYASAAPGETFIARLDPATSTYQIIDGPPGGASLIRFELYEDLDEGSSTAAHVVIWNGLDWVVDLDQLITLYDPENIGPGEHGRRGWCTYRADSEKYEVVSLDQPVSEIGWFIATEAHTLDSQDMSILHYVRGLACDESEGSNPHGETLTFYLHSPSNATCPNVQAGAILPYHTDLNGRKVADGAYLDDYRGASKQHIGPVATIPFGWHLCDGAAGTPDLRSRFLLMAFGDDPDQADFDEHGHGDEIGAIGGTPGHNHLDAANQDEAPTAGELRHYSNLLDEIATDDTELAIHSSPGVTVSTSTTSLSVAATANVANGWTDYNLSYVKVIDPGSGDTFHEPHIHQMCPPSGTGGPYGCGSSPGDNDFPWTQPGQSGFQTGTYTSVEIAGATGNDHDQSPIVYSDCGTDKSYTRLDHFIVEPGQQLYGARYEAPLGEPPSGEYGHRHSFTDLELSIDGEIDPDPHGHSVLISSIASGLWIVDETNYGDDDAAHYNLHHHRVVVDDHQLLPSTHIPPYYALAQIMRVS